MLAVLAPTLGPIVGGCITQTYSWHWLFLINVAPGLPPAPSAPPSCAGTRRTSPPRDPST